MCMTLCNVVHIVYRGQNNTGDEYCGLPWRSWWQRAGSQWPTGSNLIQNCKAALTNVSTQHTIHSCTHKHKVSCYYAHYRIPKLTDVHDTCIIIAHDDSPCISPLMHVSLSTYGITVHFMRRRTRCQHVLCMHVCYMYNYYDAYSLYSLHFPPSSALFISCINNKSAFEATVVHVQVCSCWRVHKYCVCWLRVLAYGTHSHTCVGTHVRKYPWVEAPHVWLSSLVCCRLHTYVTAGPSTRVWLASNFALRFSCTEYSPINEYRLSCVLHRTWYTYMYVYLSTAHLVLCATQNLLHVNVHVCLIVSYYVGGWKKPLRSTSPTFKFLHILNWVAWPTSSW